MTTQTEALKLALEMVQNKMYAHAEMYLKEALAQPEQCTYPNCDYPCMNLPDCKQPKQKQWVGLTDREKSNLWLESRAAIPRFHTYASLVEAKLKEKNNA